MDLQATAMSELKLIIEALLMVSDTPITITRIQDVFAADATPDTEQIKAAITELQHDCTTRSIEVRKVGGGYRLQTRARYAGWIRKLLAGRPPKLSRAQLETLAIIAYQQPVTRGDIENIRGVTLGAEIIERLRERDWIKSVGVREAPGRPQLFATTAEFLAYFNLETLADLPLLTGQRTLGEIAKQLDLPLSLVDNNHADGDPRITSPRATTASSPPTEAPPAQAKLVVTADTVPPPPMMFHDKPQDTDQELDGKPES